MASEKQNVDYDVIIIGAGISGINQAYRLQERNPNLSYKIIEGRHEIGGTWSLFKYPGLRSDSDLYTFGFAWRPWQEKTSIARADLILKYVRESAEMYGIDKHIQFNTKVSSADWSSEGKNWTLDATVNGSEQQTLKSKFLVFCTGYYNYQSPLKADIPGIDNFKGQVVHPQFWPEDLDYAGKEMVVIGSGATAVTLLPVLAQTTKHVTMLQRSPSYLLSQPTEDGLEKFLRHWLPLSISQRLIRLKYLIIPFLFVSYCRYFPTGAKKLVQSAAQKQLPDSIKMDPHFSPSYNVFEQRLCFCPDGDFYESLRDGKASIATGHIDTITENAIKLKSGEELHPDIIVTATGLQLQTAGGMHISVDSAPYHPGEKFFWKGVMLQDLPNAAYTIGYVDASWTLGADATAQMVCRILNQMAKEDVAQVVPTMSEEERRSVRVKPSLSLTSTYVKRSAHLLPKSGSEGQWSARSYYFEDILMAWFGDIKSGMEWIRAV